MPTIPLTRTLAQLAQAALILALCIAFALAIMPSGDGPGRINDKLLHGATFFVLGGLSVAAFRHRSAVAMFFALAGFGGLIEIAQWYTDWGRSAEWADMAADIVGAAIGLSVASLVTRQP